MPALIGFISQIAQLGPILYFLMKCKCLTCVSGDKRPWIHAIKRKQVSDRLIIYGLFAIGLTASVVLSLYWSVTYEQIFGINIQTQDGKPRSLVFFACVFCLAILDCTCTIVFLTYIGSFNGKHSTYITGLYIGEGVSSLLPSLFALAQGTGGEESCESLSYNSTSSLASSDVKQPPRFSVSVYFWLLFSTLFVSFVGFLLLEFWPGFRKEKKPPKFASIEDVDKDFEEIEHLNSEKKSKRDNVDVRQKNKKSKSLDKSFLLVLITCVSFILYGFIPGLSSYSALPYGVEIMHLCSTLSKSLLHTLKYLGLGFGSGFHSHIQNPHFFFIFELFHVFSFNIFNFEMNS